MELLKIKLEFLVLVIIINHADTLRQNPSTKMVTENNGPNDIVLGGFFNVHSKGPHNWACGEITEEGIYLMEAMIFAIDEINADNETLLGYKLGYSIADTCHSVSKLRHSIVLMLNSNRFVGTVGPETSDDAILSATTFAVYFVGAVSYSATSIELNDREKYYNFYRTVPDDEPQVRALVDILKHFNWKYVSTVNSHGNYGQQGMDTFISMLASEGICVSSRNVLPKHPTRSDFDSVVKNLNKDMNAKTVVLFTSVYDTNLLLNAIGPKSNFTWLSSSAWAANMETVRGVKEAAKGALLINYANTNNGRFLKHFKSLNLNSRNYTWFNEFWQKVFNCKLSNSSNSTKKICTGNESLETSHFYAEFARAGAVIDAVKAYAYALRCAIQYCQKSYKQNCSKTIMKSMKTHIFRSWTRHYLVKDSFCNDDFNNSVPFDKNGNLYRDIEIINFDGNGYKKVGSWKLTNASKNATLEIRNEKITWSHKTKQIPESTCSKPCGIGERKIQSKTKECCFACQPCKRNEILNANLCISCGQLKLPNKNRDSCKKLDQLKIRTYGNLTMTIVLESTIGIIANTFVLALFIKYRDLQIVKSSSRELSFFMLAGLFLCFMSPFIFLLDPTPIRCGLRRFIFGISLSACYTPLMLKTNRIYRIFKAAHVMSSLPQFVTAKSQIFICFGLLALQLLLFIMWVVGDSPIVNHVLVKEYKMVADLCEADIATISVNLIPPLCILAISTFYAFKSRKFPKNFNEASNIVITMYISCALWAIFFPLLLWVKIRSSNPFAQTFLIANYSNIIGIISLLGMFGPKIYRILLGKDVSKSQLFLSMTVEKSDGSKKDEGILLRTIAKSFVEVEAKSDAESEKNNASGAETDVESIEDKGKSI